MSQEQRVIIMGAAGRDFHNFNTVYRNNSGARVVAFTATQIPNIDGRRYPPALAGPRYPEGIPIYLEAELPRLVAEHQVDQVVFSYSDVSHQTVMHKAAIAQAAGADFVLLGPRHTMLKAPVPVVAVCAVRTGVGKSQTTRKVCRILRDRGLRVVAVRHPMPYGDLTAQTCQRFATMADLDAARCTLEEREEYAPHIEAGTVVYAGVDYGVILAAASKEADVIVWDGGNNDFPFYQPDVHITLVDPLRPGHETSYYPGETNLRMADLVIINKVDTASPEAVAALRTAVAAVNPGAVLIEAASPITVDDPGAVAGKRVLVVEDGPTLTHGEMAFGAGVLAARRHGAAEIVDPRPYAVGSLKDVYAAWPHMGALLPAMGYSDRQMKELEATINASPADLVIIATPVDLRRLLTLTKPAVKVSYELEELTRPDLAACLSAVAALAPKTPANSGGR